MRSIITGLLLLLPALLWARPEQVIRLEGISIQGNQEQPGVMTITPWREAPGTGRLQAPVKTLSAALVTTTQCRTACSRKCSRPGQALKPATAGLSSLARLEVKPA